MKKIKILSIVLTVLSFIFLSCNKKDELPKPTAKEGEIIVTLSPKDMVKGGLYHRNSNQAAVPEATGHHLRYILEIYTQDTDGNLINRVERKVKLTPEFKFKLAEGKQYTMLGWVDFVQDGTNDIDDEYYTTDPLTNIEIVKEKYQLNNSGRDAFSGKVKDITSNNKNITISLHRPFALLNLKDENSSVRSLRITYPSVYTAFDVFTDDVKGEVSEISTTSQAISGNAQNIIAFDYLFVHPLEENANPQKGSSLYDIRIEASKATEFVVSDKKWEAQYIPFSRNYRTNLMADFLSITENNIVFSIDSNFEVPEVNGNKPFIVSSYIRNSFYQNFDRITDASMLANNDLIVIAFNPYLDGSIYYELPENNGNLTNASYLSQFEGRKGVVQFKGSGADMNVGNDLLHKVRTSSSDGSFKQFTFGTWIYIDEWIPESYLFKKENNSNSVFCKLGDTEGDFIFGIDNQTVEINNSGITVGQWKHFALAYHGNKGSSEKVVCYVNGEVLSGINANLPNSIPFIRSQIHIGTDFKGKLDETFINSLYLSSGVIKNYMNNGISLRNTDWNSTKTLAYWKYDDASKLGKDSQSWKSIYDEIKNKVAGKDIKLRLGMAGGAWKEMMKNPTHRTNFANSIYNEIVKNDWDGVDLDFEWCYNAEEYNNYSATIIELSNKLKPLGVTFSVSLHPVSYRISQAAIDATDFISLQVYGPAPYIFPYEKYVQSAEEVISYGIPKEKLVMGLPFYGAESNNNKGTAAYQNFVKEGLISSPDVDEVTYRGKTYTFNGQTTIRKKVRYTREQGILGIMSWDIATDINFDNEFSLLRAAKEELGK